jgi:TetR/AcrR family transcriptional regulator
MSADERREQLIRVAIEVFSKKGFSGTTTKEIAAAAGVTEALIFRHFPSKEALYEAILRWKVESAESKEWFAGLQEIAERRDDAKLFATVARGMLEFHKTHIDFLRLMFYAVLEEHELAETFRQRQVLPLYDFLTDYVRARQQEGAFIEGDPGAAVRAIIGMSFYHSLVNNLFKCRALAIDDEDIAETFTEIALSGLRRRTRDNDDTKNKDEK